MSLLEKYTPKNFKEIVGNKTTYDKLQKDLKKSKYKGKYLLAGKPGTGKTSFVNLIAKLKKWKIKDIKVADITSKGEGKNEDVRALFKKSIVPKVILIDDVDIATNKTGIRNGIESKIKVLKKYMNKDRNNLIFIISTENKKSLFKDIVGLKTFTTKKIQNVTLEKYVKKIIKEEKIKLSEKTGDKVIKKIVHGGDSNIRKILMNLEMLLTGKKKIAYTEESKKIIKKNINDITFPSLYEFLGESLKTCNMNDPESLEAKEKLFYSESFILPAAVYEYYLKCENTKHTKDIDLINEIIESVADGDILDEGRKDCDFSVMKYVNYASFMKPTQLCGKPKTQLFFPSNVSKTKKINNHNKIASNFKMINTQTANYLKDDFMMLYKLQKDSKAKRSEQMIPNATLKKVYTLTDYSVENN